MRSRAARFFRCGLLLAAVAAWSEPPAAAADLGTADAGAVVRPSGCASEAEVLLMRTEIRVAPDQDAALAATLDPGTSLYRCERRGAFLGVMFPEEGASADCSLRDPGRECPTGWTNVAFETEITG
jgi:hypothetical protein